MDFYGETPAEATDVLLRFLEALAHKTGRPLRVTKGGIVQRKLKVSAPDLEVELHFDRKRAVELKYSINLFTNSFGHGCILLPTTASVLQLRHDEEGFFRWHRRPAKLSNSRKNIKAIGGAYWFPLLDEYVIEGLSETSHEDGASSEKVLVMK